MTKEGLTLCGREGVEACPQCVNQFVNRPGRHLPQMRFEFGKGQFDRIEVWTVRRQIAHTNVPSGGQFSNILDFVCGEVVQNEGVARPQLGTEHLLEIDGENFGINRAFHQEGSGDAFMAQRRDEGGTLPVAVGNGALAALPSWATPIMASQPGVQAGLINEHQLPHIPRRLSPSPKSAGGLNVGPILLGGARRFFYSSIPVAPTDATRR